MTTDLPKRLPSRPLRNWLLAWRIWTGDPPETIARGFDLDETLVAELLGPRPPLMLSTEAAFEQCSNLRINPANLWSQIGPRADPHESEPIVNDERVLEILSVLHGR